MVTQSSRSPISSCCPVLRLTAHLDVSNDRDLLVAPFVTAGTWAVSRLRARPSSLGLITVIPDLSFFLLPFADHFTACSQPLSLTVAARIAANAHTSAMQRALQHASWPCFQICIPASKESSRRVGQIGYVKRYVCFVRFSDMSGKRVMG